MTQGKKPQKILLVEKPIPEKLDITLILHTRVLGSITRNFQ